MPRLLKYALFSGTLLSNAIFEHCAYLFNTLLARFNCLKNTCNAKHHCIRNNIRISMSKLTYEIHK